MTDPKPDIAAILAREWPCDCFDPRADVYHCADTGSLACRACCTRAQVERVVREIVEPLEAEGAVRDTTVYQLVTEIARLRDALTDFAAHGLRFDLNPTHEFGDTWAKSEVFWHGYAKRMDDSVRDRARIALIGSQRNREEPK